MKNLSLKTMKEILNKRVDKAPWITVVNKVAGKVNVSWLTIITIPIQIKKFFTSTVWYFDKL